MEQPVSVVHIHSNVAVNATVNAVGKLQIRNQINNKMIRECGSFLTFPYFIKRAISWATILSLRWERVAFARL